MSVCISENINFVNIQIQISITTQDCPSGNLHLYRSTDVGSKVHSIK